MGSADYYASGDYNAQCFECGKKAKASTLRKHWQGYYVCGTCWEPRHPQDFVRGVPDIQSPPWAQPRPAPEFVVQCTVQGVSAIPGYSIPGCMLPGRSFI